ncbi:hypothetical protein, partial [Secundilactobacillus collinoides]|uniref:hypothetical protein n=1 Tax=Secundilactobacillus collinoides TaxID=33960 RepID=UPI001F31C6FF
LHTSTSRDFWFKYWGSVQPAGTRFGNVKKVLIISRTWKLGQSCLHSSPLPAGTDKLTMMNRVISKENHNDKIKTTEAPKSLN